MSKLAVLAVVFSAGVVAARPTAARAQQELGRDVTVWTWQGRVDAGRWFSLNNVNGSVTIDPSADNIVHVRAEKIPQRDGDIHDVRFTVVQTGGDVRICTLSRDNDYCDEDGLHSSGRGGDRESRRDRNVEVKYTAPDGVTVDVSESGWVGTPSFNPQ